MRLSFISTVTFVGVATVVAQSQNETYIAQEIANISSCGITCLEQTVPTVGCSLLNTTCQCSTQILLSITADCMLANCTVAESLELSKIQAAICESPQDSRNEQIRNIIILGASITYPAILLRFISRYIISQKFGLDDWFILAALCSDMTFNIFGVLLQRHGFGEHLWMIDVNTVQQLLNWFFICELFYVFNIALIKISILFFYLRVFPFEQFRIRCWIVMAFCVASGIAFTFTVIFQCHPISYAWNRDLKGTCTNYNAVSWANAAINIVQDILIVLLPVPELQVLRLSTRKKVGVYAMFGLGLIVCIASIVRLWSLRTFGHLADPTWDNVPTTVWSIIETTAAVTCACMPSIRGGFMHVFPNFWQRSLRDRPTNCQNISMALSPSGSSGKYWATEELGSKLSLNRIDQEIRPQTGVEIVEDREDYRQNSSSNPKPDLMKPLPVPYSRKDHISNLMR